MPLLNKLMALCLNFKRDFCDLCKRKCCQFFATFFSQWHKIGTFKDFLVM